jgi:hypothetical protein
MSLPRKRHQASPITGKSPANRDDAGADGALPGPGTEADRLDDVDDIELPEADFRRRPTAVPHSQSRPNYGAAAPQDLNPPPPDTKEHRERLRKKNPLEKKNAVQSGEGKFTRFVPRPETTMAAHAAASNSKAESPVDADRVGQANLTLGKKHGTTSAAPAYRPNKLFRVLDSIYDHSPMRWLDFFERSGTRIFVGAFLVLGAAGGIAWLYYRSLASDTGTVENVDRDTPRLTADQRVERAKLAVQKVMPAFFNAQTVEARLPFVTDPERAMERMSKFYTGQRGSDPKIVSWSVGSPQAGPQGDYLPLTIEDSTGGTVTVVMEETAEGVRLDWENLVAYGDANWQDWVSRRGLTPVSMRVRVRKVERYDATFTRDLYQSYEIEHRSGPPALTGYILRSERDAQNLARICSTENWHFANLYLRIPSGTEGSASVAIDGVIPNRWQDQAVKWTRKE